MQIKHDDKRCDMPQALHRFVAFADNLGGQPLHFKRFGENLRCVEVVFNNQCELVIHGTGSLIGSSGKTVVKVLPTPTVLSSEIVPPSSSVSSFTMASPNPVPPCLRRIGSSTWRNGWNTYPTASAGMPGPVSTTAIAQC